LTWPTTRPEKAPDPTDAHRALITISRRAATRRQRLTLAGSLVTAVVGIGLAGLAYWQRGVAVQQEEIAQVQRKSAEEQRRVADEPRKSAEEQRDLAEQRRIEAVHLQANMLGQPASAELLRRNFDGALRISAEGARVDLALPIGTIMASPAAAQLAATVSLTDWRLMLPGHEDPVFSAAFSTDGTRIVTASVDNTARIWDAVTWNEIKTTCACSATRMINAR
jgi:hypothetical protein